MAKFGVHHLGLASTDYEGTVDFYTNVVGWEIVWQDQMISPDGQEMMRHVFFDMGDGSLIAFICSRPGSPIFPESWATDINSGLGMHTAFVYHFSFWSESLEDLEEKRKTLKSRGVEVTSMMNHGWLKSFYFRDPVNGLMLEFAAQLRPFNEDDKLLKPRPQIGFETTDPDEIEETARVLGIPAEAIRTNAISA